MKRRIFTALIILSFALCSFSVFAADGDMIVNGKLGIGTTIPMKSLHVNGDIALGTPGDLTARGIHMGSNDGNDSSWLGISGGGEINNTQRGANLNLFGNETGAPGWLHLYGGAVLSAGLPHPQYGGGFIFLNTNNITRLQIDKDGNVGIGVPAEYKLDVNGDLMVRTGIIRSAQRTNYFLALQNDRNMCIYDNGVGVWCTGTNTSDLRLKKNINQMTGVLPQVMQLKGVRFNWIDSSWGDQTEIGVIAQDVEKFYPEIVTTDKKTGYKLVQYEKLTPVLIEAVKELKAENDAYKEKLQRLEDKLERLETRIK